MASASTHTVKTEDKNKDAEVTGPCTTANRSSHPVGGNIYTPLLATARSSGDQSSLSDSSARSANPSSENETLKPLPVTLNKQVNTHLLKLESQNLRGKRSSVRPFLCCGSELSLVSLVDGLDLTDSSSNDKKNNIECSNSSDEENTSSNNISRLGSVTSAFYSGESCNVVLRRKRRKDKHRASKKPWSQHLRSHWRWRGSQPQQSSSHRSDLSHTTLGSHELHQAAGSSGLNQKSQRLRALSSTGHFIDLSHLQDFDTFYPVDDVDAIRIKERAEEMATGVEVNPASFAKAYYPHRARAGSMHCISQPTSGDFGSSLPSLHSPSSLMNGVGWQWPQSRDSSPIDQGMFNLLNIHTQVDFIHCLVPQLGKILSCPFYWGVMDRYEAERLLDNKPEGTFLLRDSAQEDFLFSVSFRRYNRSLHARVEQWNHRFSFDAHDPAVFSALSVCDLLGHFKDPTCCMFFEPLLTRPLPRNFPFSLQHICRAVICDCLVYDQIQSLPLPNSLKQFLQVYHYKQKVRVRHFDRPGMAYDDASMTSYSID